MKTIGVFIIVLLIRSSYQEEKKDTPLTECTKAHGADARLTAKAMREEEFNDDPKVKCVFKCLEMKMGHMDDSGKIDLSNVRIPPKADQEKAKEALNKCSALKASGDTCQLGLDLYRCLKEYRKSVKP